MKLEILKTMFQDLSLDEKMLFEVWIKKRVTHELIHKDRNEKV